jgi:hypothetical protein
LNRDRAITGGNDDVAGGKRVVEREPDSAEETEKAEK